MFTSYFHFLIFSIQINEQSFIYSFINYWIWPDKKFKTTHQGSIHYLKPNFNENLLKEQKSNALLSAKKITLSQFLKFNKKSRLHPPPVSSPISI